MSKLTLNIVEPSSPTPAPVDPGIDPSVPSTGLFTHGIGGTEVTVIAITSAVLLLTIVAIVIAVLYRKHKKQNKTTKLVHMVDTCANIAKSKKRVTAGLMTIALLVSASTFIALAKNAVNATDTDEQAEGEDDSSLTVDVSSEELTIEVGDEPVFAVLPVEVSVEEATQAGYTLTAYTDSTDLVSTTDEPNTIPMIAVEGDELEALTDNTYGLALGEEPTTKDDEVYTTLSTDQSNPTIIKSMTEYTPTAENDTTTIYYGFYITPNTPYGTYEGADIYYNATINTTLVTFDGNGLYFNNEEQQQQTTNEIEYIAVPQEESETETSNTINQIISGAYKEPSQSLPYFFLGWSTDSTATVPTYTSEQSIAEFLPILPNTPLTLYAVWQKATTITYDSNGGTGIMDTQTVIAGESANLYENTFVRDGYTFTGWNTVASPTEQTPGRSYTDKELYQAETESANVTLFAQWKEDSPTIRDLAYMQDFAKLSEEDKASVLDSMITGQQYRLTDNRDNKQYWLAKQADDHVWMTQNLDLCISCEGTAALTSQNTDLNESGNGIYANGYTNSDNIISYTPARTAKSSNYSISNNTVSPAFDTSSTGAYTPYSAEGGDIYIYTSNTSSSDTTYTSLYECASAHTIDECARYHVGNYYNWSAAIASNETNDLKSENSVASNSICPAGWRLPKGLSSNQPTAAAREFGQLFLASGITSDIASTAYDTDGFNKLRASPLYFSRSGCITGSELFGRSRYGYYWSSTVNSETNANVAGFGNDFVTSAGNYDRYQGYQIRCIVR